MKPTDIAAVRENLRKLVDAMWDEGEFTEEEDYENAIAFIENAQMPVEEDLKNPAR